MNRLQAFARWTLDRCAPSIRDLYLRVSNASKSQLLLEVINAAAVGYQFFVTVYVGWWKEHGKAVSPTWAAFFAIALVYASIYNLWLKQRLKNRKWDVEEARRARVIGVALSGLSACVRRGASSAVELDQIEHGLLTAMLSEVEAVVADAEGIYLNITLLVEHPDDSAKLLSINRANRDRPLLKSYPKQAMIAWRAMESGVRAYEPSFAGSGPYQSILALPVRLTEDGGVASLAAVSVDSERAHHFDGVEAKIERKLLAYLSMLKLVLVHREHYGAWPTLGPRRVPWHPRGGAARCPSPITSDRDRPKFMSK